MTAAATGRQVTGYHVLAYLVAFFGVIISVNLTMAYFANSTWSGLVVANGYVASQSFDRDLARSREQAALGWTVNLVHGANAVTISFSDKQGKPIEGLAISGDLERTVTDKEDQALAFAAEGAGVYRAAAKLSPGVWELEVKAAGDGSTPDYRKIIRFFVKG